MLRILNLVALICLATYTYGRDYNMPSNRATNSRTMTFLDSIGNVDDGSDGDDVRQIDDGGRFDDFRPIEDGDDGRDNVTPSSPPLEKCPPGVNDFLITLDKINVRCQTSENVAPRNCGGDNTTTWINRKNLVGSGKSLNGQVCCWACYMIEDCGAWVWDPTGQPTNPCSLSAKSTFYSLYECKDCIGNYKY